MNLQLAMQDAQQKAKTEQDFYNAQIKSNAMVNSQVRQNELNNQKLQDQRDNFDRQFTRVNQNLDSIQNNMGMI